MLELKNFMPIDFLKKGRFTGGHNGICFRMERLDLKGEDEPRLDVTIWPEPYGHDATPEEEGKQRILSFDADSITKDVDWLSEQSEGQKAKWKAMSHS